MEFSGQFTSLFESSDEKEEKGKKTGKQGGLKPPEQTPPSHQQEGEILLRPRPLATLPPLFEPFIKNKERATEKPAVLPEPMAAVVTETRPPEWDNPLRHESLEAAEEKPSNSGNTDEEGSKKEKNSKKTATIPPPSLRWPRPAAPLSPVERSADMHAQLDSLMQQMPSEFAEATSGSTLKDVRPAKAAEAAHKPEPNEREYQPAPPIMAPETSTAFTSEPDEPPVPSSAGPGGPTISPPGPPTEFGASYPEPDPEPSRRGPAYAMAGSVPQAMFNTNQQPAPFAATANLAPNPNALIDPGQFSQAEYAAEKRGLRRGLIAGFITGYALKQFLANRKMRRFEAETNKQLTKRDEQITRLASEQQVAQHRFTEQQQQFDQLRQEQLQADQQRARQKESDHRSASERFEQPLQTASSHVETAPLPPIAPPQLVAEQRPFASAEAQRSQSAISPEHQAAQQAVEEAFTAKLHQHVERSAWHNIVVDERGREVQGAMQYGESFQRERQKEQISANRTGSSTNNNGGNGGDAAGGAYAVGTPQMLDSGQMPVSQSLPPGQSQHADSGKYRLSAHAKNPITTAVTNPWVWVGVAVLLIAFFAAALS
ncbi:MAG TPA: hypothetical protein VJ836_02290 [Candidatus Saccharimonadales bacterium]|nr:hypothetical protein [Candidatus Saccharimonadales bacterium]